MTDSSTAVITLAAISQKFNVSDAKRRSDLNDALDRDCLFGSLTELAGNSQMKITKEVVLGHGYQFVGDVEWDCGLAVHPRVTILSTGYRFVHKGNFLPASKGGFPNRGITWVRGLVDGDEHQDVWFGGFHSVTWGDGGADRQEKREMMAVVLADEMTTNGRGSRLAYAAGDTNEEDAPGASRSQARILADAGLITVWDELNEYPSTLDESRRTIDWVIRREGDRRSRFAGVEVFNQVNVDHHMVVAEVEITLPPPEPQFCPTCGQLLPEGFVLP